MLDSTSSSALPEEKDSFPFVRVALEGVVLLALIGVAVYMYLRQGGEEVAVVPPPSPAAEAEPSGPALLVPTLALEALEQPGPDFSARLIGTQNGVEIHYFTADESSKGFTAPADKHVIFDCPESITPDIDVSVAAPTGILVRAWGYEYSRNETANKGAGKTGRELFDGRFWLSPAELTATGEQYTSLQTTEADDSPMHLTPDRRYYLMIDGETLGDAVVRVSCLDIDKDGLNNGEEDLNGNGVVDAGESSSLDKDSDDDGLADSIEVHGDFVLNPAKPDTDNDGIQDGTELGYIAGVDPDTDTTKFTIDADPATKTDPRKIDTDNGGAVDGAEDLNHDGKVDEGETDPNDPEDDPEPICGDSMVTGSEACDDGNTAATDGCGADCMIETGFECAGTPSVCTPIVPSLSTCGNGIVEAPEVCDDGNTANGDGCSATCTAE
ncbi:MAG TPA: DUF4215 domain-containing protein [Candidatus Peribacterales bacterium]|nr:DUF4215 domain-containing protein [Candidatus Peribacterales bacterium]